MQDMLTVALFLMLASMVVVWFVLVAWLFRRLRERHALVYESLGSPTLFWNNSPRNNWLFLKFLFGSTWNGLEDVALMNVCKLMRVLLVVYVPLFLTLANLVSI